MDTIIATDGLTKMFGGKIVVNRLNLNIPQGAIFALLGGNGAGKSTTIRMLTGLLQPDAGSATILGEDCWSQAIPLRHRVGYVPEKPRFYDWMTVREIGWFTAGFHTAGFFPRYADLVDRFRLDPAVRLRTLSKGGYAKVGLALALASDPEVLILDEPTSGLDLFIRREFLASMVDLAGAGRTILISSHGIAEVERVASHVGFMAEGKLLLAASIEELRSASCGFACASTARRLSRPRWAPCWSSRVPAGSGRRCCKTVNRHALGKLRQSEDILDLEESPLNLEEMYTALCRRFHRPGEVRASSNGQHDPSARRTAPSEVEGPRRRVPREEEEGELS